MSAYDYIRSARDAIKAIEREAHNPFNEKSVDALPPPPPVAAPAVPPPKVTASTITAPTKKRHSAIVPPDAPSPFIDPADPNAPLKQTVPTTAGAVGADGNKLPPEPETPPPAASAPPMTPTKINPVHKQLLKEFSCLLLNDPLSEDICEFIFFLFCQQQRLSLPLQFFVTQLFFFSFVQPRSSSWPATSG